jgi:hypothetical protein
MESAAAGAEVPLGCGCRCSGKQLGRPIPRGASGAPRDAAPGPGACPARGGAVLIPAFSIGRTQELLYELEQIVHDHADRSASGDLPWRDLDVVVDSPWRAGSLGSTASSSHFGIGRLGAAWPRGGYVRLDGESYDIRASVTTIPARWCQMSTCTRDSTGGWSPRSNRVCADGQRIVW